MMMFRLAATRPIRLTAPVGSGAPNRPHDVALIQAALKLKPDGKSQPYYSGRIDGWFSTKTQAALTAFKEAAGPSEAHRPMDNASQAPRQLAETKEMLVLEGSSVPYLPALPKEPQVTVGHGVEVAETTRQALVAMAKRITSDVRINLKVHVAADQASLDGTLALFNIDALTIVLWNGQTVPVTDAYTLSHSAPSLKANLGKLIAEAAKDLAPSGEDWRLLDSPAGTLARLHLGRADGVKRRFQTMARLGRVAGLELAPRFLEHYLLGTGGHLYLSQQEALAFEPIRLAMNENVRRFAEATFARPRENNNLAVAQILERISIDPAVTRASLIDHYVADFNWKRFRFVGVFLTLQADMILATGQSKLRSDGSFEIKQLYEDGQEVLLVSGAILHTWSDIYDFSPGTSYGDDALLRLRHRGAKPFAVSGSWVTQHRGKMKVLSPLKRTWIDPIDRDFRGSPMHLRRVRK